MEDHAESDLPLGACSTGEGIQQGKSRATTVGPLPDEAGSPSVGGGCRESVSNMARPTRGSPQSSRRSGETAVFFPGGEREAERLVTSAPRQDPPGGSLHIRWQPLGGCRTARFPVHRRRSAGRLWRRGQREQWLRETDLVSPVSLQLYLILLCLGPCCSCWGGLVAIWGPRQGQKR